MLWGVDMKVCANCGANVEGLIGWCDCCGVSLTSPDYVVLFAHDYAGASDMAHYLSELAQKLNQSELAQVCPEVSSMELVTYCYPSSLVEELNLKNRSRFSRKNRCATVTVVFDYEGFLLMQQHEKEAYVKNVIREAIISLVKNRWPENHLAVAQLMTTL